MARRARRDLSVDEVVDHAVSILRAEGEDGLSMRRLADACGVTPMAIYHHLSDKEAVLQHAVDRVAGQALRVEPDEDWRSSMVRFGSAFRSAMIDNPGAGAVLLRRPIVGPNMALVTERFFEILNQGGIEGDHAAMATDAIVLLTFGSIANDLTRPAEVREQLGKHLPDRATPLMVDHMDTYARRDPEARYQLALRWLLHGIENQETPSQPG